MEKNILSPRRVRLWTLLCLTGATLIFIFGNSMLDADASTEQSDSAYSIFAALFSRLAEWIPGASFRKIAHFSEYTLLGAELCMLAGYTDTPCFRLISLPLSFCASCTDEFLIQRNTPGRSGEWRDVLIDTAGALTGMILVFLWILILKNKRKKKVGKCRE